MRVSVLDFVYAADPVQAALDAAKPGWSVYFPADQPYFAPVGGWKITRSLELYGDGPGEPGDDLTSASGSILVGADSGDGTVFDVMPPVEAVHVRDLQIRHDGTGATSGSAIRFRTTQAGQTARDLRLRRLYIQGFAGHGIHLEGFNDGDARIEAASMIEVTVVGCQGAGISMLNTFDAFLMACTLGGNQMNGVVAVGGAVALYGCDLDGNCLLSSWNSQSNPNEGNVKLDGCLIAVVDSCRVAISDSATVKKGVALVGAGGATLRLGNYSAGGAGSGATGIVVTGSGSGPVAVIGNRFKDVPVLVNIDPSIRDCVLLAQYDESGIGTMSVPFSPNQGLFGTPQVNNGAGTSGQPLIVPHGPPDYAALGPGTLYFDLAADELRVALPGKIMAVQTEP